MRALVMGGGGFIGKNLLAHLHEKEIESVSFTHDMPIKLLPPLLEDVDFIFHLAGVNRPQDPGEFSSGNQELTEQLCEDIRANGRQIPVIYTSSIQSDLDNPYGVSKKAAEDALVALYRDTCSPVYIYRLPNVFGKWSRPNYNSAVATFCHNIANGLPIQINDPSLLMRLVYVDDVIADFLKIYSDRPPGIIWPEISSIYSITVGELVEQILEFKGSRESMVIEAVGSGLLRALYSTYLSFLRPAQFAYSLPVHADQRGKFVEMLKTKNSGQFSFFTANPGVIRGGHYHHTKNEKFLVIQGKARFGFRHVITGETYELYTHGEKSQVVETAPGWSHDITNVGENEMIVMLWANEIFDHENSDTIQFKV